MDPFEEVPREVPVNGLNFQVLDLGSRTAEAVVFLHGFPQNLFTWRAVGGDLLDRGYRIIALNQRGYSPNARPHGRAAYSMNNLVSDVCGLLDALHLQRVHVVGHDLGGTIAFALAMWRPARVASLSSLSVPHP